MTGCGGREVEIVDDRSRRTWRTRMTAYALVVGTRNGDARAHGTSTLPLKTGPATGNGDHVAERRAPLECGPGGVLRCDAHEATDPGDISDKCSDGSRVEPHIGVEEHERLGNGMVCTNRKSPYFWVPARQPGRHRNDGRSPATGELIGAVVGLVIDHDDLPRYRCLRTDVRKEQRKAALPVAGRDHDGHAMHAYDPGDLKACLHCRQRPQRPDSQHEERHRRHGQTGEREHEDHLKSRGPGRRTHRQGL